MSIKVSDKGINNRMMFIKRLFFCYLLIGLGGCVYNDEPMPQIEDANSGRAALLSDAGKANYYGRGAPSDWLPPAYLEKRWAAIVIHHSGTRDGNVAVFDKWHKQGRHWEGVGYDFVIGNGTDSGDGEVEVTFRWRRQMVGAHCGGTANNWANEKAIGICIVGDFNKTAPTAKQMDSVIKLTRFLCKRYGISSNRVYGHNTTPGARPTECPGRRFPMGGLKSSLGF